MSGAASRRDAEWGSEGLDAELIASRARLSASLANIRHLIAAAGARWNPSPETLHELHRALRRLRIELRPWREALRGSRRRVLRTADRDLRDVARLVGEVRDRDVARQVLERLAHRHAMLELGGLAKIRGALAVDARAGRRLLPAAVEALTAGGVLEAIGNVVHASVSDAERERWTTIVRSTEEAMLTDVRRRFSRARGGRSADRLHQLRQALRSAHVWADTYTLPTVPWFPEPLADAQSELGGLHDLWVTRELLLALPPTSRARAWVGPIHARFEARCRTVRKSLDSEATVSSIHRLVGDLPDAAPWSPVAPPELLVRQRNGAWT